MTDLLNGLSGIAVNFGLDIVLISAIVISTFFLRLIFKPKTAWMPMLYALGIGAFLGVFQIILAGTPSGEWLRVILGYPIAGMFGYMTYRKLLPDIVLLKPDEDK
jgi:hypothetical protein